MPPVLREPQDPEGNRGAKTPIAQKLTADSRRFTQMGSERKRFKNITAEAKGTQRINFLFVGRRRQTKIFLKLECKFLPNRRLLIGQKRFLERTLHFCCEMSESLYAIIGENLRLNLLEFPHEKNIVEVLL